MDEKLVIGSGRNDFGHRLKEKSTKYRKNRDEISVLEQNFDENRVWGDAHMGEGRSKKIPKNRQFFWIYPRFFQKSH